MASARKYGETKLRAIQKKKTRKNTAAKLNRLKLLIDARHGNE